MVERFELVWRALPGGPAGGMLPREDGTYVRHSDYATLEAENATLRRERDEALREIEHADVRLFNAASAHGNTKVRLNAAIARAKASEAARLAAEAKLAEMGKALEQTQTALRHASFALDGVVALDDEDMGKDGGSDTCQHAKKTVDRALAAVESAIAARTKQEDRT